jgi:aminoglycoside phosphotransferase family enzyme/predicted kinase
MATMGQTMAADAPPCASAAASTPYGDIRETHTGVVVLIGERAYKVKKPVTTDFLDYSTLASRERACAREVELNRRLAPDSYLGVAHLTSPTAGPAEPVIVMRRHPDTRRLATMVRRGEAVGGCLMRIAEILAAFHDRADRGRIIDAQATALAVRGRWLENIAELNRSTGTVIPAKMLRDIERLATQFIAGRCVLFNTRIEDRRIVDGHGDLLADDIFCLPLGVEILDCLEFDDQLRYLDTIDDAAFLAMDLEFLGATDMARYFLDRYATLSGDPAPSSLKDFYIAYRAVVRAKVDCIRVRQGHPDAATDASRHLEIALTHLRTGAVRLAIVGGGPGTGKTTVAYRLAERVGAQVISTDDVRKELQEAQAITGTPGALDRGLYSAENVAAVYDAVLRRAQLLMAGGRSVILDGTWRDPRQRANAHEVAGATHAAMAEILCVASGATAAERVRSRGPDTTSDATPGIAHALAVDGALWPQARVVDTTRPIADSVLGTEPLWRDMV